VYRVPTLTDTRAGGTHGVGGNINKEREIRRKKKGFPGMFFIL